MKKMLAAVVGALFFAFSLSWAANIAVSSSSGSRASIGEYDLKAVYLYNFMHFVHWPEGEKSLAGPLKIIVVGESPFGDALSNLQQQIRQAGKQDLLISYYSSSKQKMDLADVHLVFVCRSEQDEFSTLLSALKHKPLLTVADFEGFLQAGGMIKLVMAGDNKIRWEINRTSIDGSGLKVSSKLFQMAVKVVEFPGDAKMER